MKLLSHKETGYSRPKQVTSSEQLAALTSAIMKYKLIAISVIALATAVYGGPVLKASRGIPSVGDTWGPAIVHAATVNITENGSFYVVSFNDHIKDFINPSEIFQSKRDTYSYLQSKVTSDSVIVKLDPAALEGKYLEVITSKVISPKAIKLVCHSYKVDPAFCHTMLHTAHKSKMMYSIVKDVEDGNVYPVVFFSHQGCDKNKCIWFTHINEVVVLDKTVV